MGQGHAQGCWSKSIRLAPADQLRHDEAKKPARDHYGF